jgi:hypothetical protein
VSTSTNRSGRAARIGGAVLVAAALVLASCGSGSSDSAPAATDGTAGAGDGTDAVTTAPAAESPVDPGAAEPVAAAGAEPVAVDPRTGDSDYLFDDATLHTFELELSDEAVATLEGDPTAEVYVEGTLTFEGQTFGTVGVRHKGSIGSYIGCVDGPDQLAPSGAKTCTKISMKVKINWEDSKTEFFGQRKLQFNSMNRDPSMMHERLGYWLFREMGIAAPRSTHARVMLNGEYLGVFALTEVIDGRFTRANFPDGTGNLYKEIWPFWSDFGVSPESEFLAALRTNEDEDPSVEMITTFAQELLAAAPADRPAVLDAWADVDALITYAAVDRAIAHDDGPMHWYCNERGCGNQNFYWYEDPTARTVHLIPWDLDAAFSDFTDPSAYTEIADGWGEITNDCEKFAFGPLDLLQRSAACDPLIGTFVTFDEQYRSARATLLAGPLSAAQVDAQLAAWTAQIEDAVLEASQAHADAVTPERWHTAIAELQQGLEISRNS